ncbi:MAG TPA: maleylacetate reductase [Baekduia sp.]|nr:maleylacetate reductase [Baekduia sp.]
MLRIGDFVYDALPGRIVFGSGAARTRLRDELDAVGAKRVLLVVAAPERALADELALPLGELVVGVFDDVRPHVPVEVARRACAAASEARADWVLSIGGGSTTGTAKAVALELGLPIAAVPTTYAGSEMTPVWGLTEDGRKVTGRAAAVLPRLVVYDPELTVSLPARITAASAGNGLAHCVEAFWAPASSPIAVLFAEEGIRAIVAGAPRAVSEPEDLDGRSKTLYGAYLAGSAFALAGSDIHHKICHVLGGALDLPHAETHTIVLAHALAFVEPALPDPVRRRLGAAFGATDRRPADTLHDFLDRFDIARALGDLGLSSADIPRLAEEIVEQVPASTPRRPTPKEIAQLLERARIGAEPVAG